MKRILLWIAGISFLIFLGTGTVVYRTPFFVADMVSVLSFRSHVQDRIALYQEVATLRAELYAARRGYVLPELDMYRAAKVFSLYPFEQKHILFLSLGAEGGVQEGAGVLFSDHVLLGYITDVRAHQSEAITVFDPSFSLPVRIGEQEVEGLLEGGARPVVSLVDKTQSIYSGDTIVSASRDFPYGLLIGSVTSVREDASGAFFEAVVDLPYTLQDLRDVLILVDYE